MENSESEQLDDIHTEVKGSNAELGKIAERTRNIEATIESVSDEVSDNQEDIDNLQDTVKRNTTVINAVTAGTSGVLLWVADKVSRLRLF